MNIRCFSCYGTAVIPAIKYILSAAIPGINVELGGNLLVPFVHPDPSP